MRGDVITFTGFGSAAIPVARERQIVVAFSTNMRRAQVIVQNFGSLKFLSTSSPFAWERAGLLRVQRFVVLAGSAVRVFRRATFHTTRGRACFRRGRGRYEARFHTGDRKSSIIVVGRHSDIVMLRFTDCIGVLWNRISHETVV